MLKKLTFVLFAALMLGTAACSSKQKTDDTAAMDTNQVEVAQTADPSLGAASSGRGQ